MSVDGAAVSGFCGGKTDWQGYNPVKYMLCAGALPENARYSALISLSKKSAEDGGEIIRARVPVIWIRRNKAEKLLLTQ